MIRAPFASVNIENIKFSRDKEASFIEDLRSFLSELHSLETIRKKCLGISGSFRNVRDGLLVGAQDFLPESLQLEGYESLESNTQKFGDKLLFRAEFLRQAGDPKQAEQFELLVIRWLLASHLFVEWGSTHQEITQNCINTLDEIEQKKIHLKENYLAIKTLVQNILPKRTSSEELKYCVDLVFSLIQPLLQENVSNHSLDFRIDLGGAWDKGYSIVHRKACIWTHKTPNGVCFTYVPDPVDRKGREDSIRETVSTWVFVPKVTSVAERFFIAQKSRTFLYEEERINDLQVARRNHEDILSLPGAEQFFAPLPLTCKTYVVKAPGYENFQEDLRFIHSLSIEKLLDVFDGVIGGLQLLESYNRVSGDINNENIVFKRVGESVQGLIDHCMNVCLGGSQVPPSSSRRFDTLTQDGCASFDSHRYSLVIAIAEAFFLNIEEDLPLDRLGCERQALNTLKKIIYNRHYLKVLELKKSHKGFGTCFSQALLDYVTSIARKGEEGIQLVLLEQFAFKMALFPEISSLFLKTLEADKSHQDLLNYGCSFLDVLNSEPRIPTLEQIRGVLLAAKEGLQDLDLTKERTSLTEISKDQTFEIVKTLLNKEILKEDLRIGILKRIINDVLNDIPYIGSEVRIHKNEPWKDTTLIAPFSLWICIQADKLRLEFFDPNHREVLGDGGNKDVKAGLQVDILVDGSIEYTSIAISRIKRGALDWPWRLAKGNKMQEMILEIPGAQRYFLELSRKHAPHHVSHRRKLEVTSRLFEDTLSGAIKNNALQTKEGLLYLSKRDYVGLLQNIGDGIKLIQDQGISHGDMKIGNTAIVLTKEGLRALIFDYDFTDKFHCKFPPNTYAFWNTIRQRCGFVSAETDLYGYVLIIAEVLLKGFKAFDPSETREEGAFRFQRIAEEPVKEKKWMQQLIEDRLLSMCSVIAKDLDSFFSKPLESRIVEDIPEAFFDYIQKEQLEDFELQDIEHSIVELLILDPVFNLLTNMFQADQRSISKMQKNLSNELTEKRAVLKALGEAGFPTLGEIAEVLSRCKSVAEAVDHKLHELLAVEPVAAEAR